MFKNFKSDFPAGIVVFLVALPLCLGVGLASTGADANIFAGIIAGIVGGLVVGFFSGSKIGVSGPAAGLITIVLSAISTLGSYEAFLLSVFLSGIIQLIAGFLKAGVIGNYFPSTVIKGMLAAIGITLILKEIPHLLGYDADFMGDEAFFQVDHQNTFSEILIALNKVSMGPIVVSLVSLSVLIFAETKLGKRIKLFKIIPSALIVVILGVAINQLFLAFSPKLSITGKHLVLLPKATSWDEFTGLFTTPDFSAFSNPKIYGIALTIALVGSLETLLSVEATDKLDPNKNITPTNRELKAQGLGNMISGLIGGLPVTQVIVRSSANANAGAKSKMSTIMHGAWLFLAVIFIPSVLNMIPLACLAAILIMIGYKLAKIQLFKQQYKLGWDQFHPFVVTIVAILFTDLLKGIGIGMVVSIFYILKRNYKNNFVKNNQDNHYEIKLSEEVTFLNKGGVKEVLFSLPENSLLTINGSNSKEIDVDVIEVIENFILSTAKDKNIEVKLINIKINGEVL